MVVPGTPPLDPNILALYKGENNANDETGNYNGTPGASTAYTSSGQVGNAFLFTGSANEAISVPTINAGGTYSIEFYVYCTSLVGSRHLFSNDWTAASAFGAFYVSSTGYLIYYNNSTNRAQTATGAIVANTWHKVTLTYDGSKSRIWVDAKPMATETATHSETYNNTAKIGYANNAESNIFHGRLDEVTIWDSVVRPTNGLVAHYAGESNVNDSGPLGYTASAGAGTGYATGQSGNGFSLTGSTNQAVTVPNLLLEPSYSIDFYMKPAGAASGFQHLVSNLWNGSGAYGALYYDGTNRLEYYQGSSSRVVSANNSITPSVFQRVTITYDASDSKTRLYINGTIAGTESGTHSEVFNNQARIGYAIGASDSAFNGVIDEVKFYNTLIL